MITGWILVVLQATANYTNGWQPIGTFAHRAECEQAVVELKAAYVARDNTPMRYLCIKQSWSAT